MLANQRANNVIRERLSVLATQIKLSNDHNLQDVNVYAEDFIGELFNLIWGYSLVNLNTYEEDSSIPGIDLGDKTNQVAIQVTSTATREKIVSTKQKFEKYHLSSGYKSLKVVLLQQTKPKFNKPEELSESGRYEFSVKDVLSVSELLFEIGKLQISKQEAIADFLIARINFGDETRVTAEISLLREFFREVAQADDSQYEDSDDHEDDIASKKERFDAFWQHIEDSYRSVFDYKLERIFGGVFDGLVDPDREKIKRYLRYESTRLLLEEEDPTKVMDQLKEKIINKTNMHLMSETQVIHFIYYQFYRCNVLPNRELA